MSEAYEACKVVDDVQLCLRDRAIEIRAMIARSVTDIIDIGRKLMLAKSDLQHGGFEQWVEKEVGIAARTAQAYVSAARLADGKGATVALLPPATVYRLAAKSTPAEVIDDVLNRAKAGEMVPDRDVIGMIAEAKAQRLREAQESKLSPEAKRRRAKAKQQSTELAARHEAKASLRVAAEHQVAQSIIDRFGPAEVQFLIDALDGHGDANGMIEKLRDLVGSMEGRS
ncbi:MAG: hypothetical protein JWQ51_174 [Tardiphaga sp.]|nr:hypothetical protein [Tardiphaga sp.]